VLRDPADGGAGQLDVDLVRDGAQSAKVDDVLWPRAVVAREELQRNEMSNLCNRDHTAGEDLERIGRRHDRRLDPGRREEEVPDDTLRRFAGKRDPDGTSRWALSYSTSVTTE
jgi:hypothetical protein